MSDDLLKRMNDARDFPANTCGASRHAAMIAEALCKGEHYPMLTEEPEHCGGSIAATVAMLWECRADLRSMSLDYLAASGQAAENFQMYVDANEARIDAEAKLKGAVAECERIGKLWHDAEAKLALSEGALDVASRSWGECQSILEQTEAKLTRAVLFLDALWDEGDYFSSDLYDLRKELKGDTNA